MAWDTQYALDGFFQFGGPLNVTDYVIDPDDNRFGQSTETYWVARFMLQEEIGVIARLGDLLRGPLIYYPVVHLLRRSMTKPGPEWVYEQKFYKAWLFGQDGTFFNPRSPAISQRGQTLMIGLHKADNKQIRPHY